MFDVAERDDQRQRQPVRHLSEQSDRARLDLAGHYPHQALLATAVERLRPA